MGQAIAMRRFSAHRIRWIVGILILVVGTTLTAMHFNLHEPLAKRNFASTSLCFDTSGISDVLLNPVADRLFVATFDPSLTAVSIIDTRRNTVLKAVPVGTGNWVQLALRGTKLYAATSAPDNQIAVIDLDLDRLVAAYPTPEIRSGPVFAPDGRMAYLSDSAQAYSVDLATGGVHPIAGARGNLRLSADGSRAYAANGEDAVSIIDTDSGQVSATVKVPDASDILLTTSDGDRAYVTSKRGTALTLVEGTAGRVAATLEPFDGPDAILPHWLNDPVLVAGSEIFVMRTEYFADFGSGGRFVPGHTVSVVDLATDTLKAKIDVGKGPIGLALSSDKSKVYVTIKGEAKVSVIDVATLKVISSIPVGRDPRGIVVNAAGTRGYVPSVSDGTISVIDLAADRVISTIQLEAAPHRLVVSPDGHRVYSATSKPETVVVLDTKTNALIATIPVPKAVDYVPAC